ncbi:hypothetical protein [Pseudonocardia asaccharolytica]|uniref:DUF308 domain-containing protein n=1 Tax=Pseudonocardia asaccharolytica DSM 44247 = NBRC 16224 TaxID=1123024 RepID=A0A511CY54_9PSEU|nr:hypothetical protein [Pseudonocardia asaccharolytica]GEL17173.1 hypothetical protein PA7_10100 [Pseudonocardia asaccharolytica DSM 44247 = NBRC 16224]
MNRDPEERRRHDTDQPDPLRDEFEQIVAGWRQEGSVPQWPSEEVVDDWEGATAEPATGPLPPVPDDEDHFVPPDPPPLPRLGPPAVVGLALLVLGLVLVTAPEIIGLSSGHGLPLGLLSLAAGLGWLVLRLWPSAPARDDDEDDGAVL